MPKDTKTLGNNKARACESLGFVHKKRLCQRFDTIYHTTRTLLKCIKTLSRYNPYITILIILSDTKTATFIPMLITLYVHMAIHQFLLFFRIK